MTKAQNALHLRALEVSRNYAQCEALFIRVLREVDRAKLYRALGLRSLFQYAVLELRLSESTAYMLIAVARKSAEVPRLACALDQGELSVSKASRAVSCLTNENADEIIAFARRSACREIDREVARRHPQAPKRTRVRPISGDAYEVRLTISASAYAKLKRTQEVAGGASEAKALEAALDEFLKRRDPVEKAARAAARAQDKATGQGQNQAEARAQGIAEARVQGMARAQAGDGSNGRACRVAQDRRSRRPYRVPLNARQKHAVFARDGGQCTHVDLRGRRCAERKWLHLHHLRPISLGGSNDPANLTTLCSEHHNLVHQQSFPIDGEVSWLRERARPYRPARGLPLRSRPRIAAEDSGPRSWPDLRPRPRLRPSLAR